MKRYVVVSKAVKWFNSQRNQLKKLDISGSLAELIVEDEFGITLWRNSSAQGADGRERNNHVEIKSISPAKREEFVRVKRSGQWNVLVVVKFNNPSDPCSFEVRWGYRRDFSKNWVLKKIGTARVSWSQLHPVSVPKIPPPW
jgi:hypothetical protein